MPEARLAKGSTLTKPAMRTRSSSRFSRQDRSGLPGEAERCRYREHVQLHEPDVACLWGDPERGVPCAGSLVLGCILAGNTRGDGSRGKVVCCGGGCLCVAGEGRAGRGEGEACFCTCRGRAGSLRGAWRGRRALRGGAGFRGGAALDDARLSRGGGGRVTARHFRGRAGSASGFFFGSVRRHGRGGRDRRQGFGREEDKAHLPPHGWRGGSGNHRARHRSLCGRLSGGSIHKGQHRDRERVRAERRLGSIRFS